MNHAGEITPLSRMVRPHVAVITTVEPVHLAVLLLGRSHRRGEGRDLRRASCQAAPQSSIATTRISRCCASVRASESARSSPSATTRMPTFVPQVRRSEPTGHRIVARFGDKRFPYRLGAPGEPHRAELARRAGDARRARRRRRCAACRHSRGSPPPKGRGARTQLAVPWRRHPADRRELQRQSRLHARRACRHGRCPARAVSAPRRRAGRHAGAWGRRPAVCIAD